METESDLELEGALEFLETSPLRGPMLRTSMESGSLPTLSLTDPTSSPPAEDVVDIPMFPFVNERIAYEVPSELTQHVTIPSSIPQPVSASDPHHLENCLERAAVLRASDLDPPTAPYGSNYLAIGILLPLLGDAANSAHLPSGRVYLALGRLFYDVEETSYAYTSLCMALQRLRKVSLCDDLLDCLNRLGALFFARGDNENGTAAIEAAISSWMKMDTPRSSRAEQLYTTTLFYGAQIYTQAKDVVRAAELCRQTLDRQKKFHHDFTPTEWSSNAVDLVNFYLERGRIAEAGMLLAEAQDVLDESGVDLTTGDAIQLSGNIALGRAAVSLKLIEKLKEDVVARLPAHEAEGDPFERERVAATKCVTEEDAEKARRLFESAEPGFERALECYPFDGYVSIHFQVLRDFSDFLRILSFFEKKQETKINLYRRRVGLLKSKMEELNPQVYNLLLRQISFELGEIYMSIGGFLEKKGNVAQPTLNEYYLLAIFSFLQFLQFCASDASRRDTDPSPDRCPVQEEFIEPYLVAHFNCARLYQLLDQSPSRNVQNLTKALEHFVKIPQFVEKWKLEGFSAEATVCRQMCQLLPMQIDAIWSELGQNE